MSLTIFTAKFLFLLIVLRVSSIELHGDHICEDEREIEEIHMQKHVRPVVLESKKYCLDITQGFRCKVKYNGTKIAYKQIPHKVTKVIRACCFGFHPTLNGTCEICDEGFYGMNCSSQCNCTESESLICDHIYGCCNPEKGSCGSARLISSKSSGSKWIFGVLLVSLFAVGIFLFGMIFYRKKYIKEKDPELPTLTFHPYVKEHTPTSEIETMEFNNPLYRQSILAPAKRLSSDSLSGQIRNPSQTEAIMNDYATMDEMNSAMAGPSSPYEVPYSYPTLSLEEENKRNLKKT